MTVITTDGGDSDYAIAENLASHGGAMTDAVLPAGRHGYPITRSTLRRMRPGSMVTDEIVN
eukprot:SAG25_NODE_1954_length_2103_cov_3.702096_2_plen_61_part_00